MDLKQFEAFYAIASTGSFSVAANRLNVTQSALSHQIRNLEEEVGKKLLTRARPKVYPTEAGRALLASAKRILDELQVVKEQFGVAPAGRPTGLLRVAGTHAGLMYLYGDICETFIKRYPEIELSFTATHAPDDAVMRVVGRTVDISFGPFPMEAPGLDTTLLGTIEQVLVVGPGHKLAGKRRVSIAEVAKFPFVRYQPRTGSRALTDQLFMPLGSYPPILMESNNTEFVKRLVMTGMGVALMPAFAVAAELRNRTLHAMRVDSGRLTQEIGFSHLAGSVSRPVELFKACCLEVRGRSTWNITLENISSGAVMKAKQG